MPVREFSTSVLYFFSLSRSACSARTCSVISRPSDIPPMTRRSLPRRIELFQRQTMVSPLLVRFSLTTSRSISPLSKASTTSSTRGRACSGTRNSKKFLPRISFRDQPNIFLARLFHSVTRQSQSHITKASGAVSYTFR